MKKLLVTSALAGLVISGSAYAQTTITGELRINYAAAGTDQSTGNSAARRGFGAEQQINVQTKGKLNIGGLDYAAGFAIENDGTQTTTLFNENTYMDFTNASSGTTISISRDHIQRSDTDRSAAVLVGFSPNELSADGPTKTIFSLMRDRFQNGTISMFDEFLGYPGWELHEYKAFNEFIEETGFKYKCVAYCPTEGGGEKVAMRIYK